MSDFVSGFWNMYVVVIVLGSVLGCGIFLKVLSTKRPAKGESVGTTGHVWDEDLQEWNNPLPLWWSWLFYITVAFGLAYLALYPGLGAYGGAYNWSSRGQYEGEVEKAQAKYGPVFEKYLKLDIKAVAADPEAQQMGQRLFLTYCSQCHGSDAGGQKGFPNLRDKDWQWGGEPDAIKTTILAGRNAAMPALGPALGDDGVKEVIEYVLSLSGRKHDAALAAKGKERFAMCAACHGPEGKGTPAMGAPNLTDNTWLYGGGGSEDSLRKMMTETLAKGRNGAMPAHADLLGEAKVHLLAAYVYGLSQGQGAK